MMHLDPHMHGCVSRDGYGYGKRSSVRRTQTVRGRPRYRLMDTRARMLVDVNIPMHDSQMPSWQAFWAGVGYGRDPFSMIIQTDSVENLDQTGGRYIVQATGQWSGTMSVDKVWDISFQVEVWDGDLLFVSCDIVYGGPTNDLSADDIYGGPIGDLSPDDIAPCPGVV